MKRYARWSIVLLVLLVAAAPLLAWMQYKASHVTSTNAAVRARIAEIGTPIAGVVRSISVEAGDRVTQGQVLVQLDERNLQAEVQEASAELQGLRQNLEVERLAIAHERRQVEQKAREAEANLAAAQAQISVAEIRADSASEHHRVREALFAEGGAISAEDVRAADADRQTADALLREARARYLAAESAQEDVDLTRDGIGIRERRIRVLEADVARVEARLARAQANHESITIRAPEDGAVLRRIVQPGTSVDASQPLISMWLGDDVWIEAWVEENDLGHVHVGGEATVTFRSFPDREFRGVVERIGLATDFEMPESEVPQPRFSRMRGSPVIGVGIRLDDAPRELVPGMSASVAIGKAAVGRENGG